MSRRISQEINKDSSIIIKTSNYDVKERLLVFIGFIITAFQVLIFNKFELTLKTGDINESN